MENKKKYELVLKAYHNAYAKYSNFSVGALVITKDDNYYLGAKKDLSNSLSMLGANIENASYGLSNCAERSALFSAYSNGVRKDDIVELVLIGKSQEFLYPCGACRQVIVELMNQDAKITLFRLDGTYKETTVKDIMPFVFDEAELNAK